MPANHKAVLAFRARDGGDYRRIAAGIGENTVRFIDGMLKSGPIEEQFYKSCNGILFGFRKKYGDEVLEAACAKALSIQSYTYTTIKTSLRRASIRSRQEKPLRSLHRGMKTFVPGNGHRIQQRPSHLQGIGCIPISCFQAGRPETMRYQTMEQLTELRLSPMRKEYQRQCELPAYQDLSFDDRFAEIVTAQSNNRHEARLKRLVKNADLSDPTALLADIDYDPVRHLKKADIDSLSSCDWVREGHNLIVTGATGVGKTFILSAFGHEA